MPALKQMICAALVLAALSNQAFGASAPDPHPSWTAPIKPFRIYGNSYYVGSEGLSAVLVTSPHGHVLIDGTLKQNAPLIEANIQALGFQALGHQGDRQFPRAFGPRRSTGAVGQRYESAGLRQPGRRARVAPGRQGSARPSIRWQREIPTSRCQDGCRPRACTRRRSRSCRARHPGTHARQHELDLAIDAEKGKCHCTWSTRTASPHVDQWHLSIHRCIPTPNASNSSASRSRRSPACACDILMTAHPDASDFLERAKPDASGRQSKRLTDTTACRRLADEATQTLDSELADEKARMGRERVTDAGPSQRVSPSTIVQLPLSAAVSNGQCNSLLKSFGRCFEA